MTYEQTPKPYEVEIGVAAGRDAVWEAFTRPAVLRRWFGWDYDGLDGEIRQIFVDAAIALAPGQMGWPDGSYVEVTGDSNRSTVRAVREGTSSGGADRYDAIEEGWRSFLVQLRHLLEEKPRGARRTIYLTGATTGRQALDLAAGDGGGAPQRAGTRVAWLVDPDEHLIVIAGREPLDSPAVGPMEVTVSTYGLDDAAFEVVRKRWEERWAPLARGAKVTTADTPAP
ncbi:hypothetical protein Asp14428_34910 [Actinoplanes sp. NBRC 14428]|nr:hypothetical protein Asp14428_34910 [Actinoplanes sp. NBRC 14428]